jgi:hypothetical protein
MAVRNARGTGMASRAPYMPQQPYRWRKTPGWDPAALAPMQDGGPGFSAPEASRRRRAARLAEFTGLRLAGIPVAEAARRVGVNADTGRGYEKARLAGGTACPG